MRLAVIGLATLPVHSAASRTRAITSSSGTAAATFTRGSTLARSRVTKETSASGSAPGVSSAGTALPRPLSMSSRAGLNFGMFADSSEMRAKVRCDAHIGTHAHHLAVAGTRRW